MISSFVVNLLVDTVLVPVATTAILLAVFGPRSSGFIVRGLGSGAFIVAVGFVSGYLGIYGRPAMPPVQALDWLLPLLLVAGLLYGVLSRMGAGTAMRFLAIAAFVIVAALLLSKPLFSYSPDTVTVVAAIVIPICWLATALLQNSAGDSTRDSTSGSDSSFMLPIALIATGNAIIAALTGSVMMGQLSGVLAAVTGTWWLWSAVLQRRPSTPAGRGVALALLALLMLIGQLYGNTPLWATLLLFALLALQRPVVPLLVRWTRNDTPLVHFFVTVVLAALPLATAIYFIARSSLQPGEF